MSRERVDMIRRAASKIGGRVPAGVLLCSKAVCCCCNPFRNGGYAGGVAAHTYRALVELSGQVAVDAVERDLRYVESHEEPGQHRLEPQPHHEHQEPAVPDEIGHVEQHLQHAVLGGGHGGRAACLGCSGRPGCARTDVVVVVVVVVWRSPSLFLRIYRTRTTSPAVPSPESRRRLARGAPSRPPHRNPNRVAETLIEIYEWGR